MASWRCSARRLRTEDHAQRACLAALHIRNLRCALFAVERERLRRRRPSSTSASASTPARWSQETSARDRCSTPLSGQQVGMAQRMESAAPPGGVMLSESTARLVEDSARLGRSAVGARSRARSGRCRPARLLGQQANAAVLIGRRETDPGRAPTGNQPLGGRARPSHQPTAAAWSA